MYKVNYVKDTLIFICYICFTNRDSTFIPHNDILNIVTQTKAHTHTHTHTHTDIYTNAQTQVKDHCSTIKSVFISCYTFLT